MKLYLVTICNNVDYEEHEYNLGVFTTMRKAQAAAIAAVLKENEDRNYNKHTADIIVMQANQQPIPSPTLRVTRTGAVEPWTMKTYLW